MSNYLISISNADHLKVGTIHDRRSKLKVKAFDLFRSRVKQREGEVGFLLPPVMKPWHLKPKAIKNTGSCLYCK
jgi:hypothetical protein